MTTDNKTPSEEKTLENTRPLHDIYERVSGIVEGRDILHSRGLEAVASYARKEALSGFSDLLKQIEWSATRKVGGKTVAACPWCYGGRPMRKYDFINPDYAKKKFGHRPDCGLSAAITSELAKGTV